MHSSSIDSFQIEPVAFNQTDEPATPSLRSKFQRAVSRLHECLPGSKAKRGFAPLAAVRRYAILRQLGSEGQQIARSLRQANVPMSVEQLSKFVNLYQSSGVHKRYAMQRALELGGHSLQFVIDGLTDSWPLIPERASTAAVGFFNAQGPLQNVVAKNAPEVFEELDSWTTIGLRSAAPFVKDQGAAEELLGLLMAKPWSRQLFDGLFEAGGRASAGQALEAFLSVFKLGSQFEQEVEAAVVAGNSTDITVFLLYGLGRVDMSEDQKLALVQAFQGMSDEAKSQTIDALKGESALSTLVQTCPHYWKGLSESGKAIYLNLVAVADESNQALLGDLATDSEGIISQRPLIHEIIRSAEMSRLKSPEMGGAAFLNQVFEQYFVELEQKLDQLVVQLKSKGKSAQVPELAQSFMRSKHFESDVQVFGLTLREAVAAVSLLGEAEFNHLPWASEYKDDAIRKPAIERELIQQLADSRIGNGDEQSCYEGSIEHAVLSLRPFFDFAPPLPTKGEFLNKLPKVFNQLLDVLEQEPASCRAIKSKLQQANPLGTADYYKELEPQIQFLMAREFPALLSPERKGEAKALFGLAKEYAHELTVPARPALNLYP